LENFGKLSSISPASELSRPLLNGLFNEKRDTRAGDSADFSFCDLTEKRRSAEEFSCSSEGEGMRRD